MITYSSTTLTSYNSITSTEVYYYKSSSATALSGGSWSTTKPSWENGKYIWQKIRTIYEDNTHTESDPVNITGQQGATGTAAYSYKLNASDTVIAKSQAGNYSVTKITFSATSKQGTGNVVAYTGRFKIDVLKPNNTWETKYTSTANESSKEFTIPEDILVINCYLYQTGGTTVLLDLVSVPIVADGADGTSQNLLLDVYATSLDKVKAPWARYLSSAQNTTITGQFIAEDNLPDSNATHFYRIIDSSASSKGRGLCFYNGGTPPFLDGHTYRVGCWVRNHAGQLKMSINLDQFNNWINNKLISGSEWQWVECVHTFGDLDPTVTTLSSTYKRLYFYFYNNNVEGSSLDMCGFKVEEVQTDISTARNYLLKTEKLEGWGVTGGATINNGIATFPEVTSNTWREFYPTKNFKYEIIRNKNVIFSVRVKADVDKMCACDLCIGVDSTETAYTRQKYVHNYVYFTGTGEWKTICVAMPISDEIFTVGSGTPNYDDCWVTVRISAVNTYHNGFQVTQPQLSLGTTATAWSAAPEDIEANMQEKVDNIEIGGRNFLSKVNVLAQTTQYTEENYVYTGFYGKSAGLKFPASIFEVGINYVLSFKFQKINGTLTAIGGHSFGFSSFGNKFVIDGIKEENRTYSQGHLMSDDTDIHSVEVYLTFNGNASDNNLYIQPNRGAYTQADDNEFQIWDLQLEKGNQKTDWRPAPEDVENSIKAYAESIQSQVDGMAEIHYGTAVPTLNNAPASAWTDAATKDMHVDDLYYNTSTGYCYRFTKSGSTYSWSRIKDSDITAAATAASNANTLAGQKRRIFVSQPTPPYEIGDLWVEGSSGDIKKCKTARASGSYTASDWELASKYTDDTLANTANTKVDNLKKVRLGWKVNCLSFTTSNNGECYFHGYDTNNAAANVDGIIEWNGADLTITKGMWINPNTVAPYNTPILHVFRTNISPYHADVWWDDTLKKWRGYMYKADQTPNTVSDWVWNETTDCILATYVSPSSEGAIESAQLFNPPKKFSEISDPKVIQQMADEAVDNLEIGGRNLLLNSRTNFPQTYKSSTITKESNVEVTEFGCTDGLRCYGASGADSALCLLINFGSHGLSVPRVSVQDQPYVFSIYIKNNHASNIIRIQPNGGAAQDVQPNEARRLVFHFIGNGNLHLQFSMGTGTAGKDYDITFWHPKIEYGNKVTDWSPAPEDVETEIASLEEDLKSQIDEKIQTFYQATNPADSWNEDARSAHDGDLWYYTGTTTSTYIKDNVYRYNGSNNTWTVYSASGELFDKIDGKSTIFYGTTSGTYTGVETGDYLVDSTDGSSYRFDGSKWVKVTDYQGAIDAIEIGGRNLLTNTTGERVSPGSANGSAYITPTYTYTDFGQTLLNNTEDTFTYSFDYEVTGNDSNTGYIYTQMKGSQIAGGISTGRDLYVLNQPTGKYCCVFKLNASQASSTSIYAGIRLKSATDGAVLKVWNVKLEKGNKPTTWTPAPEDTQADIDTALAQSVEYIIGTQTAATGTWIGKSSTLTELKDGTQIRYWLPYAGSGNATLNLTLKDGTTTGAIPIYRQGGSASSTGVVTANRVTTHFPAGSSISMTYGVNRVVSAVYSGTTYTGTFTGWFADSTYDSGNTYNRTRLQNAITAQTAITAGRIICGTDTGYKNIGANIAFDLSYPLLYAASAITAANTGDNNYLQINGISASNNGTITSGAANKVLYLKGTISGNTFTISASPFMTTVVPTTADGFYYIPLGMMYSATAIYFTSSNRLYAYLDGAFQPVDTASVLRAQNALNRATAVYGTSSTAAGTAEKAVSCSNFVLFNGARIQVTFSTANTANAPTLNVNSTGAKAIYINKTVTSSSNLLLWTAGSKIEFVYDGTGWVAQNVPYALYGTCSTAAGTAAKAVTCNEAVICKGTIISVNMTYGNTAANATLNVGSTVAKDIYANGAKLTVNSRFNWRSSTVQKFVFDGQVWRMDDDSVKALATAYITEIDDDGIMVHPEDDSESGWAISDAIQLFKDGISYIKLWIEDTVAKIRIGKEDQGHLILDNDSVDVKNGQDVLASFGENSYIGGTDNAKMQINGTTISGIDEQGAQTFEISNNGTAQETGHIVNSVFQSMDFTKSSPSTPAILTYTIPQLIKNGSTITISFRCFNVYQSGLAFTYGTTSTSTINTSYVGGSITYDGENTFVFSIYRKLSGGNDTYIFTLERIAFDGTRKTPYFTFGTRKNNSSIGSFSFVEGAENEALGKYSHSEGFATTASKNASHAEGWSTYASGDYSHAEGYFTQATGRCAHAQNEGTKAEGDCQTTLGKYNIPDPQNVYAVIIGNGEDDTYTHIWVDDQGETHEEEVDKTSNALAITWDGNVEMALDITATTGTTDADLYDAITALSWENDVLT